MGRAPQWILCFILIELLLNLGDAILDGRKLLTTNDVTHPDFISIDCGESYEYTDPQTGISYHTDTGFVETGKNFMVAPEWRYVLDFRYFGRQLQTLRSFPEGKRNCYTLKPKQGKNNNYLIRAFFSYGNYDGKNETRAFDLYLGVNHWTNVIPGAGYVYREIIHTPTTDTIQVCLVKTGKGIPFISTLELRPLGNSIYQTPSPSLLVLDTRTDVGSIQLTREVFSRFKDDVYDRVWRVDDAVKLEHWQPLTRPVDIDPGSRNDSYRLPTEVLMSAVQSLNRSSALYFDSDSAWNYSLEKSFKYYVYFHFVEIEQLPPGQKRHKCNIRI
ncbi:putative leucine-rich repeat receptor-like serine/threonine-protein kinase At2g19230 [Prosopis cineraria]|uniref:putative leucine-rich repeat receptor-like serine/threonine-protein kinase At2g19230 n=1 Tax=Prosopis cineraria TaxID=364024 RepID=UPI00240ECB5F|nr:putative leucine-rich repeat receptor-like serine/threonine-protein kinase At2g19230 [Prosopis cineraria]